jgi:DNA replicative helicase MCM subunit Mcm2 (Cdc46/Mcm family)
VQSHLQLHHKIKFFLVPTINRNHTTNVPLSERLKSGLDDENMGILPTEFIQKYVAYAHKYVHPRYITRFSKKLQYYKNY